MIREKGESELRRELVEVCRRLSERGLVGAGEGNVSCRLGPRRLLVTPAGANKGYLSADDLVTVTPDGEKIRGARGPSTELPMHLAAYRARPEIGAVVHAHPPTAVAFTIAGVPFPNDLMPEAAVTLGEVAVAPFEVPGTEELAHGLVPWLARHDVVLLERHGAITVGPTLEAAFDRMETLERVAAVGFRARALGGADPLSADDVARVLAAAGRPRRA